MKTHKWEQSKPVMNTTNSYIWFARSIAIILITILSSACTQRTNTETAISSKQGHIIRPVEVSIIVTNTENYDRSEETITLSLSKLPKQFRKYFNLLAVFSDSKEIASQVIDSDNDNKNDAIIFNCQLLAKTTKTFKIKLLNSVSSTQFTKRSHAEISIQQGDNYKALESQTQTTDHKIGDGLYRYEGPGWESDKIAYRRYFDERNVNDIFGKKISEIVLSEVGQPNTNYHKLASWGMDILHVGDSLGIGGVGMYLDSKVHRIDNSTNSDVTINSDGILQSQLQINHYQWQVAKQSYDIKSTLTINAGSRLTHNRIQINSNTATFVKNIVTGIVKHAPAEFYSSKQTMNSNSPKWSYIATFGKQSEVNDNLGMAIFYRSNSVLELNQDEHSHFVILQPKDGQVEYYFSGTWQQDQDGLSNSNAFISYLNKTLKQLNSPLKVKIKSK